MKPDIDVLYREQFRLRLIEAQGARSNDDMGELLGISGNTYSKYRARGSSPPQRHLTRIAKICGVRVEWLLDGPPQRKYPRAYREEGAA